MMHSPRRSASSKKPRGGNNSSQYHYRPKNKNGSGTSSTSNQSGIKVTGGGTAHSSKYRDSKPPGMDGPSDDGEAMDSDKHHQSFAKPRSRYDRYDRFGSSSPKSSPKFGGQRQGNNRRGNGGNSDRPPPRDNRRGHGRSKFSGGGRYDDEDGEEESFGGRRPARSQHKRNDRSEYRRDFRDRGDVRREDRRDAEEYRDRRYGYNEMGGHDRSQHYRQGQRSQNTHNRVIPPTLDNLINIFHEHPVDMALDDGIPAPTDVVDGQHVYPVDWLMSLRKKPQHLHYSGSVLPDSVNRNLNPTPPPADKDGPGYRHKENTLSNRRAEVPQGSWRKSPNVAPQKHEDPPASDLTASDEDRFAHSRRLPMKPPLHHGSAKTLDEAVAARARETPEDEANSSEQQMSAGESQPRRRRREKDTPEWDRKNAPEDMWTDYKFGVLDRQKDLEHLDKTGHLLDANDAVLRDPTKDGMSAPVKQGDDNSREESSPTADGVDGKFSVDQVAGQPSNQHKLRPLPVSAVDSAALEHQMGHRSPDEESSTRLKDDAMDEDETSDPEILRKQIENMSFGEDDEYSYKESAPAPGAYGLTPSLGDDKLDLSGIATNPWQHPVEASDLTQPTGNVTNKPSEGADLDLSAVMRDFQDEYMNDVSSKKASEEKTAGSSAESGGSNGASAMFDGEEPNASAVIPEPPGVSAASQNSEEAKPSSEPSQVPVPAPVVTGEGEPDKEPGENAGQNGASQPVPTEEQFRLYEDKVRHYYFQAVIFHQKYKKYEKLYKHAQETMVANPAQRDPHMEKYVEKYRQHRQRFSIVYEKYRRYRDYLEHFGRKVTMPSNYQPPQGGTTGEYHQPTDGRPYYYPHGEARGAESRYQPYEEDRYAGGGGPDPRDQRYSNMYYQQYYQNRRQHDYPDYDGYAARQPVERGHRGGGPFDGRPPSHGSRQEPSGIGGEDYYDRPDPTPVYPSERPHSDQAVPHVKGSSALKIEKPHEDGPQPNMDDDTKTNPPDAAAQKESNSEGGNGKPNDKNKAAPGSSGEMFMERLMKGEDKGRRSAYPNPGTHSGVADYSEPSEHPYYRNPPHENEARQSGGIDLSDLGYTTAPVGAPNHGRPADPHRDRDRRGRPPVDPALGHPPPSWGPGHGPRRNDVAERSNRERAQAAQYADDYMRYYSRSSGGGMTRGEFEEYQEQKRRHWLDHYRRHGYYPGSNVVSRHDGHSPPLRQPSPGNQNDYYPMYSSSSRYDQSNYYKAPSSAMVQGDYPQYYPSRGPTYDKE